MQRLITDGCIPAITFLACTVKSLFVLALKVADDHVQKHEAADTSFLCFVQVAAFSQETFQHEVERTQFRVLDLEGHRSDNSFETVVTIESNVGEDA